MPDYIKDWLEIIENMRNDNTYKLAWGRAILEIILEIDKIEDENIIDFNQISLKMLKYYWNQIFFFDLKQSASRTKIPEVVQETEKCIEFVNDKRNFNSPIWFDKAEVYLIKDRDFYDNEITRISTTLKKDVCWRFMNINKQTKDLYKLDRENKTIMLTRLQVQYLKEYAIVLSQLLNYRWAQLLEKYNNSPRIALKVKGISDEKIRRNNLTKYKEILLNQMDQGKIIDFYTGDILEENNISVDHVIPWSFMYSDDIWNLVLTSRKFNSSKNNSIPTEEMIHKLEERNNDLIKTIDKSSVYYKDLKMAIENNYVEKFYLSYRM